mmetsp:Transcript_20752/g.61959  ORF Transcript_20752/g.61959 Transcript_20752/m.61959 type:complete len:224 (+) Transcript_20752:124-795(+)
MAQVWRAQRGERALGQAGVRLQHRDARPAMARRVVRWFVRRICWPQPRPLTTRPATSLPRRVAFTTAVLKVGLSSWVPIRATMSESRCRLVELHGLSLRAGHTHAVAHQTTHTPSTVLIVATRLRRSSCHGRLLWLTALAHGVILVSLLAGIRIPTHFRMACWKLARSAARWAQPLYTARSERLCVPTAMDPSLATHDGTTLMPLRMHSSENPRAPSLRVQST